MYACTVLKTVFPFPHLSMSLAGDDLMGSLKARTVDEEVGQRKEEQVIVCLPERDKYLDMTEEEKDGQEAKKRSDRKRKKKEKHTSTPRELGNTSGLAESYISKAVSAHHCPIFQPASPVTTSTLPHLLHFTAEEIAASPGIEAETFPEMSFTESLPESHRSHTSLKSSPRCPEIKLGSSLQSAAMFSEEVTSNHYSRVSNGLLKRSVKSYKHHKQSTPSPSKTRQHSPDGAHSRTCSYSTVRADSLKFKHQTTSSDTEPRTPRARSNSAEVDESR